MANPDELNIASKFVAPNLYAGFSANPISYVNNK